MFPLIGLALLLSAVSALTIHPRNEAVAAAAPPPKPPLLPDDDPFYKAPPGIASTKPGTILRSRPVPSEITLDNIWGIKLKQAVQLLYRTQNSHGNPQATVVTVLVPFNAKPKSLFPLMFFAVCCLKSQEVWF